uniref:Non-SMC condensin II complex subunit G2 n=1 Tax=Pseudonaja textilis TaxID=8673 RepID=A0A670ZSZ7_PSETE
SDSLNNHLSRKQKEILWNRLKNLLSEVLLDNPVEEWQRMMDDSMETEENAAQVIFTASIPTLNENIDTEALLECAVMLNGILPVLPDSEQSLSEAIQCFLQCWWKNGLEGKEQLGKTAFLMFLKKSLEKKTIWSHIICLCHLQPVLQCFDYDSEESNEVKDLLLQCFMSSGYIKREEGRRFLSFLFTWNVNFIKLIHGTIKNQLLLLFSTFEYLAGCVFLFQVIEYSCIQDFMHHAVHLPRKSPLHAKVREILSYFHKQNKCRQGVEEVLYRLYQPILWRALKARNSEIRSNAALLFSDAFPILDPRFNTKDLQKEIQRQFDELFVSTFKILPTKYGRLQN